jgi:ABC-2 type transport system ATP-binding protein
MTPATDTPAAPSAASAVAAASAPGASPAVLARDLSHHYREIAAVDGVTLDVQRGEVFGLVGPDGAGKSTLIRMIATVLLPDRGDCEVFGASVSANPQDVKPHIGYMSQRFSLYRDLTVRENVDFFAKLRGVPRSLRSERAEKALHFAGLGEFQSRRSEFLSGGMKQKLALAVTLMHEPDLLLLDEPTTGVDPVSRREFWRIIADLHRRGITVFVATPYMDEAERCTRVAFMDGGKVLLCDTPAAIKASVPGHLFELQASDQRAAIPVLREIEGVSAVMVFGEALRVLVAEGGPDVDTLVARLRAREITVAHAGDARMDMETAFSFLVESERAKSRAGDAS